MFNVILVLALAASPSDATLVADEIHEGKVVSVSEGKITILDRRDDDNDTFVVTAETKITRNGKPAKLTDIQTGDRAKIIATTSGGSLIAKEVIAAAPT
jgi:hypothetical protein